MEKENEEAIAPADSEPIVELEALIFSSRGPATPNQIRRALPDLSGAQIGALVDRINDALRQEGRPYEIAQVAGGYQFRTRPEFASVIRAAQPDRTLRLSRAALETLAVVGYRQPLTRAEVEEVRAVDSGAVLRGLLDRGLVRIVGRRDAPGRPTLYGTSHRFLETFGLKSLRDLPALTELKELELQPSAQVESEGASENSAEVAGEADAETQSSDALAFEPDADAAAEPDGSGTETLEPH
jgi:segregation and condensation protein B